MMREVKLRTGYTTGSCAAAAAKAAAIALITGRAPERVEIELPIGKRAEFEIAGSDIGSNRATCSVIKDAGDDPDVTNGALISSTISYSDSPGITIDRGEGVGIVTKPGLELDVGTPAINPVPRRMIEKAVSEVAGELLSQTGLSVIISVKDGEEMAKETLNPKLGILEGISILGTSGIVRPYSAPAYRAAIAVSINVAVASGNKHLVLTTGSRSEEFSKKYVRLPDECYIQVGDFPRFGVRYCSRKGVKRITFCGMIGKLSKIAEGYSRTSSDTVDINIAFLIELSRLSGVDDETLKLLRNAQTARHFAEMALKAGVSSVFDLICGRACENLRAWADGEISIECIMVDFQGNLIGRAEI